MPQLTQEIAQKRPFSSIAEEALLNLMRSADCIQRAMQRTVRQYGITSTQYNVLRILRGAYPDALTCGAIGERMITAEPDITRLLSRLKGLKLVEQHRGSADRRAVLTCISRAGLDLLTTMEPEMKRFPQENLGHLSNAELVEFVRLLEASRLRCGGPGGSPTCDGK